MAGVAGLLGQVYGETAPSVTDVEVIGDCAGADRAINVYFADSGQSLWFAEDMLDLLDHGAGTEARIGGRRLIRTADGDWIQEPDG